MVNVRQIAEMGAYVKLLEYDNIEGMILLSELSRRRIRSIQKLIRVGKNEVVVVLRVDKEKGKLTTLVSRNLPRAVARLVVYTGTLVCKTGQDGSGLTGYYRKRGGYMVVVDWKYTGSAYWWELP